MSEIVSNVCCACGRVWPSCNKGPHLTIVCVYHLYRSTSTVYYIIASILMYIIHNGKLCVGDCITEVLGYETGGMGRLLRG